MSLEKMLVDKFTESYGIDLKKRFLKLEEEQKEVQDEWMSPELSIERLKSELSDELSIITHLASLLGSNIEELLLMAIVKHEIRKINPNYKR